MDIPPTPADLEQVVRGQNGRLIPVDDDVQNVANGLRDIDSHFRLRFSERGQYFVVYWQPDGAGPGDGYLVTTAKELDQRIVKRVEQIHYRVLNDPTYNVAAEADRLEAEAKEHAEYERQQEMAEKHEKLHHAMRKDLGYDKGRIWIPHNIKKGQG